jgi:hypothetical protein
MPAAGAAVSGRDKVALDLAAKPPAKAGPNTISIAAKPAAGAAVSGRDKVALDLAAKYRFTVRFGTSKGNYALTSPSTCVVTLTPNATLDVVKDVLRHEYIHVLHSNAEPAPTSPSRRSTSPTRGRPISAPGGPSTAASRPMTR